ncbi:hypothetical protein G4B88_000873 [Cannabis sativa]|uniref:RNase H type-1 domain-containing protein n=1 Tax=Cannabis sativa TaxID=3483 RepID=A0A7J6EQF1_CANSA|nr:hypothetical protein G4B88_000873 [Cannabis sativa]
MKAKYFPRESFWSVSEKNSDSFVWRSILKAISGVAEGACSVIVSGEFIDIWWQSWFRGWVITNSGAYWAAQSGRFNDTNRLWSWIWNANIHPRLSLMLWRTCANVLPMLTYLIPTIVSVSFVIPCAENPLHLFASCPFALALWFNCPYPIRLDTIHFGSITELLCKLCEGVDTERRSQMLSCFAVLFETIWKVRNRILHNAIASWSVDQARRDIANRYQEFVSAPPSPSPSNSTSGTVEVSLNITSKKLVVVDDSFSSGLFGCVAILLDRDSLEWGHFSAFGSCASALAAEMEAVIHGIKWAQDDGWDDFTIASDSKILVHAIRARKLPDWQLAGEFYSML